MFSLLDCGSGGPSSSPGQDHCNVFLGKELSFRSAFLPSGLLMDGTEFQWRLHL